MTEEEKQKIEDIRAFLKWAIDNDQSFMGTLSNVGHDITGFIIKDRGFTPRTAGYSTKERG